MSPRELTCQGCGLWFRRDSLKGPTPKWCGANCKKKAYRARLRDRRAS